MNKAEKALMEIQEMADLAAMQSPIHGLAPLAKLFVTIAYVFCLVSFSKYALSGLVVMILYPLAAYSASGVPVRTCFYKLRFMLPLVCLIGLLNPLFDKTPCLYIGGLVVTGGVLSMITLMLKGVLCLMASFLLIATTSIEEICLALRQIHVPKLLTSLLLLTYRYVGLLLDEVAIMTEAYQLRAPGQKGIHFKAWGSFLGELLLRTMDRATAMYASMELRGFSGEFFYAKKKYPGVASCLYVILWLTLFGLFRFVNVTELLGGLFV